MKIIRTFGRTVKAAELAIEALEQRGSVSTAQVEPVVRKILTAVRKRGDKALTDYATKFDGLQTKQPLRVPCRGDERGLGGHQPEAASRDDGRARQHPYLRRSPEGQGVDDFSGRRRHHRPDRSPNLKRWMLCSRWPLSSTLNAADDRHACSGRRSRTPSSSALPSPHRRHSPPPTSPESRSSIASAEHKP